MAALFLIHLTDLVTRHTAISRQLTDKDLPQIQCMEHTDQDPHTQNTSQAQQSHPTSKLKKKIRSKSALPQNFTNLLCSGSIAMKCLVVDHMCSTL
eukprot:6491230-Amphidinium_carterae.2